MFNIDDCNLKVLNRDQILHFAEHGFTVLPSAFDPALKEDLAPIIWRELGVDPDDRSTWTKSRTVVTKILTDHRLKELPTPRAQDAFDDLCGEGRWQQGAGTGYTIPNFPGFDTPPWGPSDHGHVDGNHFHHHLHSPEQGLVGLYMFTDIDPEGGGTWIRSGSHRIVARLLADREPEGVSCGELCNLAREHCSELPLMEVTGRAGDMMLMHPHTFHGSSKNLGDRIRLASNICLSLKEPMKFCRESYSDYSIVERVVLHALHETVGA